MLSAFLQNQSAIYASGVMTSQEREDFELVLEFHDEVREFVSGLVEVGTSVFLSGASSSEVALSAGFKDRLSARIDTLSQDSRQAGLAVTGPDGLVQWINPRFMGFVVAKKRSLTITRMACLIGWTSRLRQFLTMMESLFG